MSRRLPWPLALAALLGAATAAATSTPPEAAPARPARHAQAPPGVKVPAWSELSAYQQEHLRHLGHEWDRLPASRRVFALERIERQRHWETMSPHQRRALREGARHFQEMPPALRSRMRESIERVKALPPDQQRQLRAVWKKLSPQQRRRWLEAGGPGLAPAPAPDH